MKIKRKAASVMDAAFLSSDFEFASSIKENDQFIAFVDLKLVHSLKSAFQSK